MFANFTSNLAIFEVCDRLYKNFFAAFLSRILTSSIFTPQIKNLENIVTRFICPELLEKELPTKKREKS